MRYTWIVLKDALRSACFALARWIRTGYPRDPD
jgi:hypothetical protein